MKRKVISISILAIILIGLGGAMQYFNSAKDYKDVLIPEESDTLTEDETGTEGDPIQDQETKADESEEEKDYLELIGTRTVNLLILGIDESKERDIGIYRSDVIIVVRLDLDQNNVKILSIPRDTYAYLPIRDQYDKIGHAYAFGSREDRGPEASAEAVDLFLGERVIDHYFAIKMDPVPGIVNDIGGVEIDVEVDMYDPGNGVRINKGLQTIDGDQALLYIQWRDTPRADIDRILRVQHFLASLYGQLKNEGQIMEGMKIVLRYREGIETDLSAKQLLAVAAYMKQLPEDAISYFMLSGKSKTIDGRSVWIPDDNSEVLSDFFSDPS